jgi:hypothetical protein
MNRVAAWLLRKLFQRPARPRSPGRRRSAAVRLPGETRLESREMPGDAVLGFLAAGMGIVRARNPLADEEAPFAVVSTQAVRVAPMDAARAAIHPALWHARQAQASVAGAPQRLPSFRDGPGKRATVRERTDLPDDVRDADSVPEIKRVKRGQGRLS